MSRMTFRSVLIPACLFAGYLGSAYSRLHSTIDGSHQFIGLLSMVACIGFGVAVGFAAKRFGNVGARVKSFKELGIWYGLFALAALALELRIRPVIRPEARFEKLLGRTLPAETVIRGCTGQEWQWAKWYWAFEIGGPLMALDRLMGGMSEMGIVEIDDPHVKMPTFWESMFSQGGIMTWGRDDFGRLVSTVGPRGRVVMFRPDGSGSLYVLLE
jgi:hypothetical protein